MKKCDCGQNHKDTTRFNRREFLQISGTGLAVFALMPALRSTEVLAQTGVTPLSTADACIFIKLAGAPSHLDTFDIKQGAWTPSDWDIQTQNNITLPARLFPNLLKQSSRLSIVHSVQAWAPVHQIGQYWIDTSQDFNAALVAERPSLGAVVAMEYQSQRKPSDVLPGFVSIIGTPAGGNGFLNGLVAPFPIAGGAPQQATRLIPPAGVSGLTHPRGEKRFGEFWDDLQAMDAVNRSSGPPWGKPVSDYNDFYNAAHDMLYNAAVAQTFQYSDGDRQRYGGTQFGDACLVARNLIAANNGTRFVHITFNGWDHHQNIYNQLRNLGPVLDKGLAGLLDDLANTPGSQPGSSLLDRTLIVVMGEFGRTPPSLYQTGTGLNSGNGRDHYPYAQFAVMAGGGVHGGRNIGRTNDEGAYIADPGWKYGDRGGKAGPNIRMEDIGTTIYSTLGINWTREIWDTPSRRVYQYINGGPNTVYREIRELFE